MSVDISTDTHAASCWLDALDQSRRRKGKVLDTLGLGPQESEYSVVFTHAGLRLRHYGNGDASAPVLLIVPAPIKAAYIWDMAPDRSVVRQAQARGFNVYMIEWTEPGGQEASFGLADYGGIMIDACIDAIAQRSAKVPVFLAGHSLGGTLATLYCAYQPKRVAGLVLIESPLHFAEASGAFKPLLDLGIPADALLPASDHIPGSLLNLISAKAAPETYILERYVDYLASHGSIDDWKMHWRAVRWTLDELLLSRALFDEVVERLYREDQFMRGDIAFGKIPLSPRAVTAPLLAVYDPSSRVIPPESVLEFYHAAGSETKELMTYTGDIGVALQHVGMLIGQNAHDHVWPQIFNWLTHEACGR